MLEVELISFIDYDGVDEFFEKPMVNYIFNFIFICYVDPLS